jgi:very-short-patch-repair endonuclease
VGAMKKSGKIKIIRDFYSTFIFISMKSDMCKKCEKLLLKDNITGYCIKCYNLIIKDRAINRRRYVCPRCGECVYSNNISVTNKNIKRGYCYKCLAKEISQFLPYQKECIICNTLFWINTRNNRNIKTCGCNPYKRKTSSKFISEASKIHGNIYDYSMVEYKNSITKVKIICKKHGIFEITPGNHLHGRKCPKCQISKGETKIMEYLTKNNIDFRHQHKFIDCRNPKTNCMLKFDFYIKHNNLLIEFDGEQHNRVGSKVRNHILTQVEIDNIKMRDELKNQYAKSEGIKLLRIPHTKFSHIDDILTKEIYGQT